MTTNATPQEAAVAAPQRLGVALLSGGGEGIGSAIAIRLADAGHDVAILDIAPEVAGIGERVQQEYGVRVRFYECDLSDSGAVESAVRRVTEDLGPVEVMVHNAGWTPYARFLETSEDDELRVLEVNLRGFMRMCRHVLPAMVERGGGRVVIVSSDAAKIGIPGEAVYSGAKAGLVGFGKALAAEHARHAITVNVVSPGSTDSPMLRNLVDDHGIERRKKSNPMRRLASPDDIAEAVAFFVGPGAGYLTGQVLSVNGGALRA